MEWFISEHQSPYLQECPVFLLSLKLCHLYMSHCISTWFLKTGRRSFSHAIIYLSVREKWITFEQNGSLSNKLKEKQALCSSLARAARAVWKSGPGAWWLFHTQTNTHYTSLASSFPFLKTQFCAHTTWDPDYEVRRNIARFPPSQVLEYIRYFSSRMKHWQQTSGLTNSPVT